MDATAECFNGASPIVNEILMIETKLKKLVDQSRQDEEVLAVILFGSQARGEATPASDIDVCLVLAGRDHDPLFLSQKKLDYLTVGGLDLHLYQQLPIYIRRRVLKEGRVLFVRNEDALYEIAFRSAQAFEDFRHYYEDYLNKVAHAGP